MKKVLIALLGTLLVACAAEEPPKGGGDGRHGDTMAVTVAPGETADLEVVVDEPGTWYLGCHLLGHYEAGMEVPLTVSG